MVEIHPQLNTLGAFVLSTEALLWGNFTQSLGYTHISHLHAIFQTLYHNIHPWFDLSLCGENWIDFSCTINSNSFMYSHLIGYFPLTEEIFTQKSFSFSIFKTKSQRGKTTKRYEHIHNRMLSFKGFSFHWHKNFTDLYKFLLVQIWL